MSSSIPDSNHPDHMMKNDIAQQLVIREIPDVTVLAINEIRPGLWYIGFDYPGELSQGLSQFNTMPYSVHACMIGGYISVL